MKAETFKLQTVVNPNTGEESKRIAVGFDNGEVIKLFLREQSIEEFKAAAKADRESMLSRIVVRTDGQFGKYCVVSNAKTEEEF